MPAFVLVEIQVHEPDRYEEYKRLAEDTVAAFGGRYVVRGGGAELLEGEEPPARIVVLEFPSRADARAWYDSPAYREAMTIRQATATTRMILADGTGNDRPVTA